MEGITLDASIITGALTAAGAVPAGLLVQAVIQGLKAVPQFSTLATGREKLLCFVGGYVIVVLAYAIALTAVPPTAQFSVLGVVALLLSGFNISRLAMASYDDFVAREPAASLRHPAPRAKAAAAAAGAAKPPVARPTESILNPKGWVRRAS
jgi:hypothetical protein